MKRTFYYDKDLDAILERGSNYFEERPQGPAVISDDVGAGVNGLRHMPSGKMLDSKSAHRRETKARGLVELGSDNIPPQRQSIDYGREVRDAHDQWVGDWNGTREQVRKMGG